MKLKLNGIVVGEAKRWILWLLPENCNELYLMWITILLIGGVMTEKDNSIYKN